jgi:hypothetical protein
MTEEYTFGIPSTPAAMEREIARATSLAAESRSKGNHLDEAAFRGYARHLTDRLNGIERCPHCGAKKRRKHS